MFIKQISVFIENKTGKLSAITKLLADNHINLRALSIADTPDYGILRLIASDPRQVALILSSAGYICNITDVLAITLDDHPGAVSEVLSFLSLDGVNIEYAYAFVSSQPGNANLILRVSDGEKAMDILNKNQIHILSEEEIYSL